MGPAQNLSSFWRLITSLTLPEATQKRSQQEATLIDSRAPAARMLDNSQQWGLFCGLGSIPGLHPRMPSGVMGRGQEEGALEGPVLAKKIGIWVKGEMSPIELEESM